LCWHFGYNRKNVSALTGQFDLRLASLFLKLLTPMINKKRALKDMDKRGPA
jgi:hypothetical protein